MAGFKKTLRPVIAHIKAQKAAQKSSGGLSKATNPGKVSARRPAGVSRLSKALKASNPKKPKAPKAPKQTKGGFKPGFTTRSRKR